ncbi:hypothetical protein HN385_03930 [archaeon]|nr:hypothetical protein [archaeon]MBT3450898.1 hypothetical protein [archaeon]MBT6869080.1 hypothetical protein [archaeon]MBT7193323.1 hypothetical protein [archaeon]MBT7380331.1 hypothetical protein [archaeon]
MEEGEGILPGNEPGAQSTNYQSQSLEQTIDQKEIYNADEELDRLDEELHKKGISYERIGAEQRDRASATTQQEYNQPIVQNQEDLNKNVLNTIYNKAAEELDDKQKEQHEQSIKFRQFLYTALSYVGVDMYQKDIEKKADFAKELTDTQLTVINEIETRYFGRKRTGVTEKEAERMRQIEKRYKANDTLGLSQLKSAGVDPEGGIEGKIKYLGRDIEKIDLNIDTQEGIISQLDTMISSNETTYQKIVQNVQNVESLIGTEQDETKINEYQNKKGEFELRAIVLNKEIDNQKRDREDLKDRLDELYDKLEDKENFLEDLEDERLELKEVWMDEKSNYQDVRRAYNFLQRNIDKMNRFSKNKEILNIADLINETESFYKLGELLGEYQSSSRTLNSGVGRDNRDRNEKNRKTRRQNTETRIKEKEKSLEMGRREKRLKRRRRRRSGSDFLQPTT